jgi:hypothetical protein
MPEKFAALLDDVGEPWRFAANQAIEPSSNRYVAAKYARPRGLTERKRGSRRPSCLRQRDPNDASFFELAVAGNADWIITPLNLCLSR